MEKIIDDNKLERGIISLIVLCYNGEKYIQTCLNCILAQDWRDRIELIFVNDGSHDRSDELFEIIRPELEENLYRVHYIYQDNTGVGSATNTGLKYVSGEYLCTLDIDDYLFPESIRIRAEWLTEHPDCACVYTNGYFMKESAEEEIKLFYPEGMNFNENSFFDYLLDGVAVNWAGTYMIRFPVWLRRFPDRKIYPSRSGQNMQLLLPAAYKEKTHYIDKPLMKYLVHYDSLSSGKCDDNGYRFNIIYKFEDIYVEVLSAICDPEDKQIYLEKIRRSSIRTRINIARRYQNKKWMRTCQREFLQVGGMTRNDKIAIYSLCNPPMAFILRFIRKVESLCRSEAEQNTH